ncbi:hypothetical protein MRB53_026094 [Persea americana]|uniref:Uncharacterized protein n=1 Tax=Persea americana TaxID=3435 RepID=A0ACC2LI14_PERAE|nr:hypothetical protein MRB53_026094 [Persea americana]
MTKASMTQVVRVRREALKACMTCPLCNKLLKDATTISECLHTFCRKCIYEKLNDDEMDSCPICNTDLGCAPLEKLRPDHNLQDVRAKIFPFKTRKVKAPEIVPSISLPVRRKERSLSSLVVNTPRVSSHTGLTGRRTKAVARRALRGPSFPLEDSIKKEEDTTEDYPESSSSRETLNKIVQNRRQNSTSAEPSNNQSNKDTSNGAEPWLGKDDMWKPLNCLVEAANRTKGFKFTIQGGSIAKTEQIHDHDGEVNAHKTKVRENANKSDGKKGITTASSESIKPRRFHGTRRKRGAASKGLNNSAQALLDAAGLKRERRIGPIWLSLVASDDQEGDGCLPQISASYLRIKDGNLPVSFIQKYLVKKLDLTSEAEVEITCKGKPVVPTLALHNLVGMWLREASSKRVAASVGISAKDFVMVLSYARATLRVNWAAFLLIHHQIMIVKTVDVNSSVPLGEG